MRAQYQKLLIVFIILLLIGSTAVEATVIQTKLPSEGNYEMLTSVSLYAGNGNFDNKDGAVLDAAFRNPQGIAILEDGSVLIADSKNHLIRQIKNGQVSIYAGMMVDEEADGTPTGGLNDGALETAVFNSPTGVDTDSDGNVYIADQDNHVIRKISKDGTVLTIAGDGILGHENGVGSEARFYKPQDVAVAADGTIYVADTLNHVIRRITTDGKVTTLNAPSNRAVEVIAGYVVPAGDYADGKLTDAKFNEPTSIAIDNKGNLYVSDTGNHVIRYIDMAKGTVSTVAGVPVLLEGALYGEGGYADGNSSEARFYAPRGIAFTEEQGLVIADSLNHTVRYLLNGQVSTIAGVPTQFGHVDGINGHNLLHHPSDVAVLPDGSLLIADSYNNKVRKLAFYELPNNLPQIEQVKVVLENHLMNFDTEPLIMNNRTMIPVRALSEKLGYEVVFEYKEQTIVLSKGDNTVKMQIGNRDIWIENADTGEKQLEMDVTAFVKAGRTYVPIRFFSEAFGVDVQWDSRTNTVILRKIKEVVEKQPLADRHSRTATLEDIKGTVWINKAGGSLTYRAYDGITLHHGDHIITEYNSSAVLITADRKDEITIGENAKLYISNLSNASQVMHTSFNLWSGSVFASVTSLVDSNDTFVIMTGENVANVRGTHFAIVVDPFTGMSSLAVLSGVVQTSGNRTSDSGSQNPVYIYPTQQISSFPDTDATESGISFIDPVDIVNQASPEIIEALLKAKEMIDQENAEFLERMRNASDFGSNPGDNPSAPSQEDLDRLKNNLDNLLLNVLKQAKDQKIMNEDQINEILNQIGINIDLNNVPPLQLTAEERKKQEEVKQKIEEAKKKAEEKKRLLEEQKQKQADLLAKIQEEKDRLEAENKRRIEEAKKKAEELKKQQLSEAARQELEKRKQELEQQRQQQEAAQQQTPTTPTPPVEENPPTPIPTPSTPTPVNRAPVVNNDISDKTVTTKDSIEFNISEVFSGPDGDSLTFTVHSSDTDIAETSIEGELIIITPKNIGVTTITITADDGKGGKAQVSFQFKFYGVIEDLRAEVMTNFINLYWDSYGDYKEEELTYHIYKNGELFDTTTDTSMYIEGLEPNTTYSLRVEALYNGEIIAFGDYDATTMEPLEDNDSTEDNDAIEDNEPIEF